MFEVILILVILPPIMCRNNGQEPVVISTTAIKSVCLEYSKNLSFSPASSLQILSFPLKYSFNALIFDSLVFNMSRALEDKDQYSVDKTYFPTATSGSDITFPSTRNREMLKFIRCLAARYAVGKLGSSSVTCVLYTAVLVSCLIAVLVVILTRFFMALGFHWAMSNRKIIAEDFALLRTKNNGHYFSYKENLNSGPLYQNVRSRIENAATDPYIICMVTCFSEDEKSLRMTLDSIAGTSYQDSKKLLFVVCDGLIKGAGNTKSTPEIVIGMIKQDCGILPNPPIPMSYLAIADGEKQHNKAQVYAGHYYSRQLPVPIVVVVKCGTEQEWLKNERKIGNRGKRDSQLILMQFLSRVTFDDRMTALDYDLFRKIHDITGGVTADKYQLLLMVDADTVIKYDSLANMTATMMRDDKVMGLCGETRVANKNESWITKIQVFEYFSNHNLGKAFESVFGGVTCLPGCFCMYRIKVKKGKSDFVPLLVNPTVVESYSENLVDTLHKKNLLLLGEDRFLSTLMLANFPKRKMIFVPDALCHTTVPNTFKMLLSQRRRWINSTIHNMMELVMMPNLCGTFCLSMSFVIAVLNILHSWNYLELLHYLLQFFSLFI